MSWYIVAYQGGSRLVEATTMAEAMGLASQWLRQLGRQDGILGAFWVGAA